MNKNLIRVFVTSLLLCSTSFALKPSDVPFQKYIGKPIALYTGAFILREDPKGGIDELAAFIIQLQPQGVFRYKIGRTPVWPSGAYRKCLMSPNDCHYSSSGMGFYYMPREGRWKLEKGGLMLTIENRQTQQFNVQFAFLFEKNGRPFGHPYLAPFTLASAEPGVPYPNILPLQEVEL